MGEGEAARILIVDDEASICGLLSRYLAADGYQCVTATSGEGALQLLQDEPFDLLLADVMMPGMSGIDLLNVVKSLYPDVAVLMVTAVDDRDTGILALELGAYGYIIKPFERNEILINVSNALERRRVALNRGQNSAATERKVTTSSAASSPLRISATEAINCIRAGMDDAELMRKFRLSAKALHSLFDQLVAAGKLEQSEIDSRGKLSAGTVIIDFAQVQLPEDRPGKTVISLSDALMCIREGMDDSTLMERYQISAKGLRSLFRKLLAAGVISRAELDERLTRSHNWAVIASEDGED